MLLPDINDPNRNVLREMWNRLSALPGGRRAFSKFVGMAAPYTGTIHAHVEELGRRADGSGFCKVSLEDRRSVRNHLNSIHAIALANLAEVAGNLAPAARPRRACSRPPAARRHRWCRGSRPARPA